MTDEHVPVEEKVPRDEICSFDEYNEKYESKIPPESSSHGRLKKLFLKPALAVILGTVLILSANGRDPLGTDFLGNDRLSADAAPSVLEATEETPGGTDTTAPDDTGDDTDVTDDTTDAGTEDTDTPETEAPAPDEDEDEDEFPALGNLDPDFAGDYAWSGDGSEEYIRFGRDGDTASQYLVKGGAWAVYDPAGTVVEDASAVYDKSSNTLTLNGFTASYLDVNLMGNGFTIELVGDNDIGVISIWGAMYGGSVKFVGSGSLTVNSGITLNCEGSESCLMVGKGVTLDVSGDPCAIGVYDSTMSDSAIYLSKSLKLTGGTVGAYGDVFTNDEGDSFYSYSIVDDAGEPATHIRIEPNS
ncbi:MAG: hypothetical protein IJQ80_08130 [Clostridia bacterium]|nr:hypothetical protein [Clostridia bacterium]